MTQVKNLTMTRRRKTEAIKLSKEIYVKERKENM